MAHADTIVHRAAGTDFCFQVRSSVFSFVCSRQHNSSTCHRVTLSLICRRPHPSSLLASASKQDRLPHPSVSERAFRWVQSDLQHKQDVLSNTSTNTPSAQKQPAISSSPSSSTSPSSSNTTTSSDSQVSCDAICKLHRQYCVCNNNVLHHTFMSPYMTCFLPNMIICATG